MSPSRFARAAALTAVPLWVVLVGAPGLTGVSAQPTTPQPAPAQPATPQPTTPRPSAVPAGPVVFPFKRGEVWRLTAVNPGNNVAVSYPVQLLSDPERDDDGDPGADAVAENREAYVWFSAKDGGSMGVTVYLEPNRGYGQSSSVYCIFDKVIPGTNRYRGTSFFGSGPALSEAFKRNQPSAFGTCTVTRG